MKPPSAEAGFAVCTAVGTYRPAELARCAAVRSHGAEGAREDAEAAAGPAGSGTRRPPAAALPPCPDGGPRGSLWSKGSVAGACAGGDALPRP